MKFEMFATVSPPIKEKNAKVAVRNIHIILGTKSVTASSLVFKLLCCVHSEQSVSCCITRAHLLRFANARIDIEEQTQRLSNRTFSEKALSADCPPINC
jgi:hypothetical protein